MRITFRRSEGITLDFDNNSRRGEWVVYDDSGYGFPVIRTDDYRRAADVFIVRSELMKSLVDPDGYEMERVLSRDGRALIRTIGTGPNGPERVWMAVDRDGVRRYFPSCIDALSEFLGSDAVRMSLEGYE